MAERRPKVIWTEHEENLLFPAIQQVYKTDPKASATKVGQLAQMVLPENRRRKIQSPLHFPARLRTRMMAAGLLTGGQKAGSEIPDKNILRIEQLGNERDSALQEATKLQAEVNNQRLEIEVLRKHLKAVPTEAQVVKNFFADILWEVETRKRAVPGASTEVVIPPPRELKPQHIAEPQPEGRPKLPKILIVGGKGDRIQKVETALNGKVRISHWRDGPFDSLDGQARTADMVYLIMGDVSHDQAAHVTRSTDQFQRVQAYGTQPLIDLINNWLERRVREGVS